MATYYLSTNFDQQSAREDATPVKDRKIVKLKLQLVGSHKDNTRVIVLTSVLYYLWFIHRGTATRRGIAVRRSTW